MKKYIIKLFIINIIFLYIAIKRKELFYLTFEELYIKRVRSLHSRIKWQMVHNRFVNKAKARPVDLALSKAEPINK